MIAADEVRATIRGGESFTVEFEGEERGPLNDRDLVEAVVCLANGVGGRLLVGVEDDGRITGARPRHEAGITTPHRVAAAIANRTRPSVRTEVELVDVGGTDVLVSDVTDMRTVVGTTDGVFKRRVTGADGRPQCLPMAAVEMLAHEIDRGALDHAALPAPGCRWEDLDPLQFERLRNLIARNRGRADAALGGLGDRDIARALGVVGGSPDAPEIRVGAVLLFGREDVLRREVPTHEVAFQVLEDTAVSVNDFSRRPVFQVADDLVERFAARVVEEEFDLGLLRIGVPSYDEVAFREAIANALVHRDYTKLGAVHVQWQRDRIEVSSPGELPSGVTTDTLLTAAPNPRSPLLADAFKRAGLVERTGRGVNRIFEGQARYGRRLPSYARTTEQHVVVSIPGGPANLRLARFVVELAERDQRLGLEQLLVLNVVAAKRRASTRELAGALQRSPEDTLTILSEMVETGLLEARGERKGRTWHLSASAYRALGDETGYVRTRGFDRLQQEQMVLSYVDSYGSISRSQAADLCSLSSKQAYRLLASLRERGDLEMRGERRAAVYARPS
ncbi:MAG: AAA family ATPase [Nitriliruptor sp.]|nr:MAG: AAA family ATPase [Nitriliruptor sp.]